MAVLGVAAAVAAGAYWWWHIRPQQEEPCCMVRCPKCGRKLRYRSERAGHKAICPSCKNLFSLPIAPTNAAQ